MHLAMVLLASCDRNRFLYCNCLQFTEFGFVESGTHVEFKLRALVYLAEALSENVSLHRECNT